jgi:hypothetical protein
LVREDTRLADRITLTERLMGEGLLVILTSDDTRRDHFLAGSAMQRVWLSAITRELVASVLTQPLHLHEVRAGLIERLELNGYPQLILRLGYPSTVLPVTVRACVRGGFEPNFTGNFPIPHGFQSPARGTCGEVIRRVRQDRKTE